MKEVFKKIFSFPLDVKIFIFSSLLIFGILFFPDKPDYLILYITYIVFCFVSIAISAFFMTYVADSKYNYFRNVAGLKEVTLRIVIYFIVCIIISYILAITEWFLFLF